MRIDTALHRRLLELARASGASLFMVLQAGLAALLSRLGAGEDIPIGTPVAGRGEQALEDLVGFFVNTLVLRTDVAGDPSFRELLHRVRAFDLEAYEHQDLPFERLVEALQPTRSLARHPLFQVMFVLQNTPESGLSLPGLSARAEPLSCEVAKFDLTLDLVECLGPQRNPQGIEGALEFSRDLFEQGTAQSIAARFVRLLNAAVATPDAPLYRLDILDAGERHTLEEFNATAHPLPEATLPELFEAQVARTPEAVAVVCDADTVTYAELNARANRLAHHLIGLGVGPECLVGVCLERSVDMVVAILGILKAGGAYLPLDPEYPESRLALMLTDTRATVLLTRGCRTSSLLKHDGGTVDLDIDRDAIARQSSESLAAEIGADNLAYVMYTSGSTGRPRGVGVPHRAIVRLLFGTDYVRLDESVSLLQLSPTSFDASTFELWGRCCMAAGVSCFRVGSPWQPR